MAYWSTRGLRGSALEEQINLTNALYRQKGLAVIQKIPTPITPVEVDNERHTISRAYFGMKSTVDYIGAAQGVPVCFDAKETTRAYLPIQNIHGHQIAFMEEFERQDGVCFLIVSFRAYGEIYYLPFADLKSHWDAAQSGGRKSVPRGLFDREYIIGSRSGFPVHYLEGLKTYLSRGGTGAQSAGSQSP